MLQALEAAYARRRALSATVLANTGRTKAAGGPLAPSAGMGMIAGLQQTGANREKYSQFRGWLYSAINVIASEAAGQPVQMGRMKGVRKDERNPRRKPGKAKAKLISAKLPQRFKQKAVENELEILENHDFKETLEQPNPVQGRWQFTYSFVANICLTGISWVIGDGKEVYSIPTTWVTPDHTNGTFSSIWVSNPNDPGQKPTEYKKGSFGFAMLPNPANPLLPYAPVSAQAPAVRIDDNIQTSQEQFFENGIFPSVIITVGKDPHPDVPGGIRPRLTAEQRRQVYAAIASTTQGVQNYGTPAIVDGLIESIEKLSMTQNELGWEKSEEKIRTRILSAFCVHPYLMGENVSVGGYAQVANIEKRFYKRVNTYLDMLSGLMTAFAAPEDDEKLLVWWEECEASDPQMRWANLNAARTRGDISQTEYRAELGYGPDEDGQAAEIDPAQMAVVVQLMQAAGQGLIKPEQAQAAFVGMGISEDLAEELAGDGPTQALQQATQALQAAGDQQQPAPDENHAVGRLQQEAKSVTDAVSHLFRGFCPTGEGGGVDNSCGKPSAGKPAPAPAASDTADDEDQTEGESKAKVGTHVKKLAGNKAEAEQYVSQIDEIDKTFGGAVSHLLEKYPLEGINVTTKGIGESDGIYNAGTQKLLMRPSDKVGDAWLFEEGSTIANDHGRGIEDEAESKAATMKATFAHELGHHVAHTVIKKTEKGQQEVYKKIIIDSFMADEKKPSKYAETMPHEYFAESFAAYHVNPGRLSPMAKKMVQAVIQHAEKL